MTRELRLSHQAQSAVSASASVGRGGVGVVGTVGVVGDGHVKLDALLKVAVESLIVLELLGRLGVPRATRDALRLGELLLVAHGTRARPAPLGARRAHVRVARHRVQRLAIARRRRLRTTRRRRHRSRRLVRVALALAEQSMIAVSEDATQAFVTRLVVELRARICQMLSCFTAAPPPCAAATNFVNDAKLICVHVRGSASRADR